MCPTEGRADLVAIDWSVQGDWDSVGQQALFACSPAGMLTYPDASILMRYKAIPHQWSAQHEPWAGIAFGHGYDGTAYDPEGRIFYRHVHQLSSTDRLLRWDVAADSALSSMDAPTGLGYTFVEDVGICWFPTWGSAGGLVMAGNKNGGGGRVAIWDKGTDTWAHVYTKATSFGTYEVVCHYNPVADRIVFGSAITGGTVLIMDNTGTVLESDVTPCPVRATVSPGGYSFVADPNGTESLVFALNDDHIYGLDLLTGAWTDYGVRAWMTGGAADVGFSIPDHNCIMLVRYGIERTNQVWLYRHTL